VAFEGLLSAKVTEESYWEPYEWKGKNEPVPGHGEKLVLYRVNGTSGADATTQDISLRQDAQMYDNGLLARSCKEPSAWRAVQLGGVL